MNQRAYVGGKYAFEIDNSRAGWLYSAEGGDFSSDVVQEKLGSSHLSKKHLAGVKYDDITIVCGAGMSKAFYDWVKKSFENAHHRQDGAIVHADYNYKEVGRLSFFQSLITEFGMPALDAAGKDPAKMTVKIKPEVTRKVTKAGGKITPAPNQPSRQKLWTNSNFRLEIDGLESATKWTNKVEALVIKQKVAEHPVGQLRDYEWEATAVEVPNLVFTVQESHAAPLYKWAEDFIVKGKSGETAEKSGSLEYLSTDLSTVLFRLEFFNLGIFKISADKQDAGTDAIRRCKVEMYCEDIQFSYTGNATWNG